jgi:hypothetical protein
VREQARRALLDPLHEATGGVSVGSVTRPEPNSRTTVGGSPLPRKLGIKEGAWVALIAAPDSFDATLGALPDDVRVRRQVRGPLDVIVFFTTSRSDLERRIDKLRAALDPAGRLWVAWPKRASGVATDVTEDVVRAIALEHRLVDNKVAALDATWSGLQLVIRLVDRPG